MARTRALGAERVSSVIALSGNLRGHPARLAVWLGSVAVRFLRSGPTLTEPAQRPREQGELVMTTAILQDIVRDVMDRWKDAVDAHDPQRVADLFAQDAIFQGLRPYTVGRAGVFEYYDSQPLGLTAQYEILETRQVAEDVLLVYLGVDFAFTDRPTLNVWLSVLLTRTTSGWSIRHYQVSKLD
jgi:uncharacterized protein (TIGR02246 family)